MSSNTKFYEPCTVKMIIKKKNQQLQFSSSGKPPFTMSTMYKTRFDDPQTRSYQYIYIYPRKISKKDEEKQKNRTKQKKDKLKEQKKSNKVNGLEEINRKR